MTCSVGAAMAVMRHDIQCQRFSGSASPWPAASALECQRCAMACSIKSEQVWSLSGCDFIVLQWYTSQWLHAQGRSDSVLVACVALSVANSSLMSYPIPQKFRRFQDGRFNVQLCAGMLRRQRNCADCVARSPVGLDATIPRGKTTDCNYFA